MRARNTVIVSVAILLILVGVGVNRINNGSTAVELGFSEEDLDDLETQLTEFEFDDLEGISYDNSSFGLSIKDLDALGDALQGLEYDDLEGLTDN